MEAPASILFLCPHNAAKSLLAVADFDRMAPSRGLAFWATSAGTEPADSPSAVVVAILRDEGIDVSDYKPRTVTEADMASARCVISIGGNPDELPGWTGPIERWDDVPPVRHDLEAAREALQIHLAVLVDQLAAENQQAAGRV
jgi:hypothetical protein